MVRVVVMPSYSVTMVTCPITSSGVVLSAITKSNDDVSKSFSVIPMAFKISRPPTDTSAPPSGMTLSVVERNWPLSSKTRRETVGARRHRRGFRIDPTTVRPIFPLVRGPDGTPPVLLPPEPGCAPSLLLMPLPLWPVLLLLRGFGQRG